MGPVDFCIRGDLDACLQQTGPNRVVVREEEHPTHVEKHC